MFDEVAGEYDRDPSWFSYFGRRLVDLAGVKAGDSVLDVATGRGAVLLPAAAVAGSAGRVVGIDLSAGMVRAAAEEVARRGLAARIIRMEAEFLAFAPGSFDVAFCAFGLMFFSRPAEVLRLIRRLLRAEGTLAVSTWQVHPAADLAQVLWELQLSSADDEPRFGMPDELERLLFTTGFDNVEITAETTPFAFAEMDHYWQAAMATGLRPRIERLEPAQLAGVRGALSRRLRTRLFSGQLHIAATALLAVASRN
jgi:ubiquinone/menaquinone biosynthesis C-methylase UbiE